ncbi:MAG: transposase, partial [Dehalococcoidia bacterium]
HRHAGIGYFTPEAVHSGHAPALHTARIKILATAYAAHPERFVRHVPQPPSLPTAAWINPPPPFKEKERGVSHSYSLRRVSFPLTGSASEGSGRGRFGAWQHTTTPVWPVNDAVWAQLTPLLTIGKPREKPGWPQRDDRVLFAGVIWLSRTEALWAALPQEFGPKATCHDRFQEQAQAEGVRMAWALLLAEYNDEVGLGRTLWLRPRTATPQTAARPAPSDVC